MRSFTVSSAGSFTLETVNSQPHNASYHPSPPLHCKKLQLTHIPNKPARIPPTLPSHNKQSFFTISNETTPLSNRATHFINQAIQNSLAPSTIKRYDGAIRQFIRFCNTEQIPEHLRFPANEFVLCAFAASSIGTHSMTTPRNRLSALKAWHIAHNMDWNGSTRLRYVLNGVHNLAPGAARRPPRPPINARMLSQLVESLDLESPFDAAVAACATTAFWGQCRLGELLPNTLTTPLSSFPTRSDFKRSIRNPLACLLHLPRTKTHAHGQDIVLVDQHNPINPISLLKNHIRVNRVNMDGTLFSYISANDTFTLTKTSFLQRCNAIWHPLGYPRTTGHCFRIGGTTELLIAGTPPDVVKATGRWSSESFLRYWRSLDDIAPQHIRNLTTPRRRHRQRTSTTFGG